MIDFDEHRCKIIRHMLPDEIDDVLDDIAHSPISLIMQSDHVLSIERYAIPLKVQVIKDRYGVWPDTGFPGRVRVGRESRFWSEMRETFPSLEWFHYDEYGAPLCFRLNTASDCVLFRLLAS